MFPLLARLFPKSLILNHENSILSNCVVTNLASLKTTAWYEKESRAEMLRSMPKPDEGAHGEHSIDIDYKGYESLCEFPDEHTPNRVFDGVCFKDLPIVQIKVSKNNTHITLRNAHSKGVLYNNSCGREGFKHCRKGTNVAAQTTALSSAKKILRMGIKTVRVMIRGLGPGRMASIKGLQVGGLNIVAICDATPAPEPANPRPCAARSV